MHPSFSAEKYFDFLKGVYPTGSGITLDEFQACAHTHIHNMKNMTQQQLTGGWLFSYN